MIKFPEWCTDGFILERLSDFGIQTQKVKFDQLEEFKKIMYMSFVQQCDPIHMDCTLREIMDSVNTKIDQVIEKEKFRFDSPGIKLLANKWDELNGQ